MFNVCWYQNDTVLNISYTFGKYNNTGKLLNYSNPHEPGLRENQYPMISTVPTARANKKTLRYSLDQTRVVAVATAITIVFAIATPPSAFFPPVSCIPSVLVNGAAPFSPNLVASATGMVG